MIRTYKQSLEQFDYTLPQSAIAYYPPEKRGTSRLMVMRKKGTRLRHTDFNALPEFLKPRDVLVFNNTKVFNARIRGKRQSGGRVEALLLERRAPGRYAALVRPRARLKEGEVVSFGDGTLRAAVSRKKGHESVLHFNISGDALDQAIDALGEIPLPPYIARPAEELDKDRYQTVYASVRGASAAPTAGLHFTDSLLNRVKARGVDIAFVTLHTGYGTFAPIRERYIEDHRMHEEYYCLDEKNARSINEARDRGGRIIAVGTTSCRVLETCAARTGHTSRMPRGHVISGRGYTKLYMYPGYRFRATDGIVTNFHLPKSTLFLLVAAFAGRDRIHGAYHKALKRGYRFFSYGDAMLIV